MDMCVGQTVRSAGFRAAFERLREAEIELRRALAHGEAQSDRLGAQEFQREAWASEADVAFSRQPVACFIAIARRKIVGFACHDATCPNFFGPTGVDPAARNKGLGAALLFACLEDMRHAGYGYAIIGGVGPGEFYAKSVGAVAIEGSGPGIYRGLL